MGSFSTFFVTYAVKHKMRKGSLKTSEAGFGEVKQFFHFQAAFGVSKWRLLMMDCELGASCHVWINEAVQSSKT